MNSARAALATGLVLMLAAGCAAGDRLRGPDPIAVDAAIRDAAEQVRRCYRKPKVTSDARQIATRLRVRFAPDGSLAALPEVIGQTGVTPLTRPYASRMAEAASLAVMRCAPLRLPAELYRGGWEDVEFSFSPQRLA